MTANKVGSMNLKERKWWFKRLKQQKDDETDAVKANLNK